MSEAVAAKNDFKFILNGVRADSRQGVAEELARLFPLDLPTALNITEKTPIILLDKLTPQQARFVGTYAIRLRALGADVQVTGQPVGKLQVLRWPLLPDIAKRPGNHVICPNCGARLQMQVHVPAADAEREPAATATAVPREVSQEQSKTPSPEVADEAILEPVEAEGADVLDEDVLLEEPPAAEPAPAFAAAEPPAPPAAPDRPKPIGGEGAYSVVLVGKIKGKKKRDAAELMASYLGMPQAEATAQLNKKTVVIVARELTEKQAEKCRDQFADINVKVTIKG